MNPYLSIIVPVYKVEKYLHQCIDSILAQTFKDFELILVDDGSPDDCPKICDDYAKKDFRIKVIHKENEGLIKARKVGLEAASGQYIGFVDSDDWIEKNMYELLCEATRKYEVDIALCDMLKSFPSIEYRLEQYIQPGLYNKKLMEEKVYPYMLYSGHFWQFGILPTLGSKIFKKDLIDRNLSFVNESIRMGEDAACTYPSLLDATSIYILDKKYLYHYRQNPTSMTKNYDEEFFERIITLYNFLKERFNSKNTFDLSRQLYYYFVYLTIGVVDNEFSEFNNKKYRVKRNNLKNVFLNQEVSDALKVISLREMPFNTKVYIWLMKMKQITLLSLILMGYRRIGRTL